MTNSTKTEEQVMEEIFDLQTIKAIEESEGILGEFEDYLGYVVDYAIFEDRYWE